MPNVWLTKEMWDRLRPSSRLPANKVCPCGQGHASRVDGKCGHCRTRREAQAHRDYHYNLNKDY